jgi:hypothetical protein
MSHNKKQGKKASMDTKPNEASVATRRNKSNTVTSVSSNKKNDDTVSSSEQTVKSNCKEDRDLPLQSQSGIPEVDAKVADDSRISVACKELTANSESQTVDASMETEPASLEFNYETSASVHTSCGESCDERYSDEMNSVKQESVSESIPCGEMAWESGVHMLGSLESACSSYQSALSSSDESRAVDSDEMLSHHTRNKDSAYDNPDVFSHVQESENLSEHVLDYPTMSQNEFLAIFKLIHRSELPPPSLATANRLHREAGGTLRRCIKSNRVPHMIYRRTNFPRDLYNDSTKIDCLNAALPRNSGYDKDDIVKTVHGVKKVSGASKKSPTFVAKRSKVGKDGNDSKGGSVTSACVEANDDLRNVADLELHDLSMLADAALAGGTLNKLTSTEPSAMENFSPSKADFKKPKVRFASICINSFFV